MQMLINIGIGLTIGLMINAILTMRDVKRFISNSETGDATIINDKAYFVLNEVDYVKYIYYKELVENSGIEEISADNIVDWEFSDEDE